MVILAEAINQKKRLGSCLPDSSYSGLPCFSLYAHTGKLSLLLSLQCWSLQQPLRIHHHSISTRTHQHCGNCSSSRFYLYCCQNQSERKNRESLSIYQDLSLADIEKEYWDAMKDFPIQW